MSTVVGQYVAVVTTGPSTPRHSHRTPAGNNVKSPLTPVSSGTPSGHGSVRCTQVAAAPSRSNQPGCGALTVLGHGPQLVG